MRGLSLLATVALAALVGSGSAASIPRLTVMSATCQGASGPFPNPSSCRSFLQCEPSGHATVMPCPADLEFNPKLRVCDFAYRAGCSSSSTPPADDDNGSDGGSGDNNEDDGGVSPAPPSDAPTCPAWNPNDVTQLPNPKDCSTFYKCDENGVAWIIKCPAGLLYNAELRVCDYPENVDCSSSSSPSNPSDDEPSNPSGDDSSNSNDDSSNSSDDSSNSSDDSSNSDEESNGSGDSGNNGSPQQPSGDAPSCPPWNPNDVTQLPNPSDCSSFYKCDENGVAWLIPCPAGLQYNAKLRVCDYTADAGCSA